MTYKLGIACVDKLMNKPYLMTDWVDGDTWHECVAKFLSDPSIAKAKANDVVMCLASSSMSATEHKRIGKSV